MSVLTPSFNAAADIFPNRFVKITGALAVSQCVAGEFAFGISQEGRNEAPIPLVTSLVAASAGQQVGVFGLGETCLLQVGAAVTAGAYLKPDANGRGVPTTTAGDTYSAIALEAQATVDGKVLCFIRSGKL